jgi:hypothetical protein
MTTTTAPQWTITAKDENGKPLQIDTQLRGDAFYVYADRKGWSLLCETLRLNEHLEEATTPQEAITEAVVLVIQRLAELSASITQLSAELSTIPLIIEDQ